MNRNSAASAINGGRSRRLVILLKISGYGTDSLTVAALTDTAGTEPRASASGSNSVVSGAVPLSRLDRQVNRAALAIHQQQHGVAGRASQSAIEIVGGIDAWRDPLPGSLTRLQSGPAAGVPCATSVTTTPRVMADKRNWRAICASRFCTATPESALR